MADTNLDGKLAGLARQYDAVLAELARPETSTDPDAMRRLGRELARLEPVVAAYRELGEVREQLRGALDMLHAETDEEMKAMAREEVRTRSSGTMCPSRRPRIGLIDRADPSSAPAFPIRPPRRRYSRVST